MAASARPSRRRQKKLEMIETTFEELSSKPAVEETAEDGEDGEDSDGPVVFICGKCNLAVGDSLSWEGSEEDQNQIRLKGKFVCAETEY